jgi:hypothetical protein
MKGREQKVEEPTYEELLEALRQVDDTLHHLGGAWQLLPGKVRVRLVGDSQIIEDLLERAGALPVAVSGSRAPRVRHLPRPRPFGLQARSPLLGRVSHEKAKP